ncbi:MAG: redoxin domain-containing protein [Dehalococcoidia bacterium]|nr:redoxin domain-containing protein [Dehalococcoidia bacterium]MXY87889.1 redoxin domain-containing protein [Dehalococcoidia bacterium]MYA52352.1 redoxin domain-containing protein [Dehalococcoidia bacterium]
MLGWELQPEGLCRGTMCVPVDQEALVREDGLDLRILADALQRPLVTDEGHAVAALGASHHDRGDVLASLEAPDFTLPDLEGNLHSLSDHRGKKVLLVAYASW